MPINNDEYNHNHLKLSFIGVEGQKKLQQAKILVIGAGGLGCPCLQGLAGCGIGVLGIADFDTVSLSNLHRQFLYDVQDIGKRKTLAAIQKLSLYNPSVTIETFEKMVDETNVLSLVKSYDVIIDCTDNFLVRYLINDACVYANKPLVYGAIHQTEGHVTVFNYNNSPTLRCLFPGAEMNTEIQSCAAIGAYNIITGITGFMMANEAIKIILKDKDVLAGRLNQFDTLSGKTLLINYQASADGRKKSMQRFQNTPALIEISPDELMNKISNKEIFHLIDVREEEERALFNIGGEHIPLKTFLNSPLQFSHGDTAVIYCQHGIRSLQAAYFLHKKGFNKVQSLHGGMYLWQQKIK